MFTLKEHQKKSGTQAVYTRKEKKPLWIKDLHFVIFMALICINIQLMKMCKQERKNKKVKLHHSYPEEKDVTQTHKKWQTFFLSFTINTFNSLAERWANFKIVHIWSCITLC